MIVAVDAAGGDHYPKAPVEGALLAVKEDPNLSVLLLGPEEMIKKRLKEKNTIKPVYLFRMLRKLLEWKNHRLQLLKASNNHQL